MAFKMKGFSAFTRTDDDIVEVPGGDGVTINVNTGEVIKPKLKMTKKIGKLGKRPTPPPQAPITEKKPLNKGKDKTISHSPRFYGLSNERIQQIKNKKKK